MTTVSAITPSRTHRAFSCFSRSPGRSRPRIRIAKRVYAEIFSTIGARPPESGGILLGPIGENRVTEYFFDAGGSCSSVTYTPDHVTLNRNLQTIWRDLSIKGFVHSHPEHFPRPSGGDLRYIARLLDRNPEMSVFLAPIVLPAHFTVRPYVVRRADPNRAVEAVLDLFDDA